MKKILLGIITSLFLLSALTIAIPGKMYAANTGIQISPVTYEFNINPGETITGKMLITNRNNETMDYALEVELFKNSSEDGVPSFEAVKPETGVTDLTSWVSFPEGTTGSIDVNKDKEVNFTITVPGDAEPGGHYGAIFAKQTKPIITGSNAVGVVARVGALVLVSIPGEVSNDAQIIEFNAPKIVWKGPVDFSMRVKNNGSVHYNSSGKANIKNIIGKAFDIDLGTHIVLPKNIRAYSANWGNKYPFGYYKVTPTTTDGEGNIVSGTPVIIWAIPLIIVIPSLIGLILLILLIIYLRKHVRFTK
jgi:hypothetical protein